MIRGRAVAALAVVALVGAGAGAGGYAAAAGGRTATTVVQSSVPALAVAAPARELSVHQIYERTGQSVVEITDITTTAQHQKEEVLGSGFVYDSGGHVVTNYHVVLGGHSIKVRFADGSEYPATLVGHDASTDLAVLEVGAPASKLHTLALADSSKVQIGDPVVAIGSPFGLAGTVTSGIVSALDRTISSDNAFSISGAIQTDAAINHGNSGGPLLNEQGRVIGITSQIESEGGGSDGVGFAISSDTVRSVVTQLLSNGKVVHAFLGIGAVTPPSSSGALVAGVQRGSPAARAGLRPGDVITGVDGHVISDPNDLIGAVNAGKPDEVLRIRYLRAGQTKTVRLALGARSS